MTVTIDADKLKKDLRDYYGAGAMTVAPAMIIVLGEIDNATPQKLCEIAKNAGIDILEYATEIVEE